MKPISIILSVLTFCAFTSCSNNKLEEKGFSVNSSSVNEGDETGRVEGINKDSVVLETRPGNVLLTGLPHVRLTTVYKVNTIKKDGSSFIGSNNYLYNNTELEQGNNWHGNLIPGLEGVYGYNLVNISHYNLLTNKKKALFDKPVLIKTVYYPSFSKDSLHSTLVQRNFILVSAYNDDSNKDGFINQHDLRRFYLFDSAGVQQKQLVPDNYSVYKSEYDSDNDIMFVFARLDSNNNGQIEDREPASVFWVDLKDPMKTGQQY